MVLIGVIVAVLVLAVGGYFGYKHFSKPHSPEDQIRSVVQREVDEINKSNFSWDGALQCKANEASTQEQAKDGPKLIAETGTWTASVANVHVTGDSATADVTIKFQKLPDKRVTKTFQFIKEGGSWKECTPGSPDDDNGSNGDSGG